MTRRIDLAWPDPRPFADRSGRPIRLLAVSDAPDPALEQALNREAIGSIDGIVGCGDLEESWLNFLGDAFHVPVVFVRGNHDRGGAWRHGQTMAPLALPSGHTDRLAGIAHQRGGIFPGQVKRERHPAVLVGDQIVHHGRGERAAETGMGDGRQGGLDANAQRVGGRRGWHGRKLISTLRHACGRL